MIIKRVGKMYEVVDGYDTIFTGGSYEAARDYLAINGIADAKYELHRGHTDIEGEYDLEESDRARRERLEVEKRHHSSKRYNGN